MVKDPLRAPFAWFGGKRRIASLVWDALGDVDNYVEPFAGSLAVLLARPASHQGHCETVNDIDRFLANFWRALAADPEAVAAWTDWPVNEADLFARHLWLVNEGRETLAASIERDPLWYDPKIAGWWVWGRSAWIGDGWCLGTGSWVSDGRGRIFQRSRRGDSGRGVDRKLPHLGTRGSGVNCVRLRRGTPGRGGRVVPRHQPLYDYFRALAERLRFVRVCCGDWTRVVTAGALHYGASVGVFLDPPYDPCLRRQGLYSTDDPGCSESVRRWALDHGLHPRFRIVLAGYEPEHADQMADAGWTKYTYVGSSAYQTTLRAGRVVGGNQGNRRLERVWFSPHCQRVPQAPQASSRPGGG